MNSRLRQTLLVEMPPQTRRNVIDVNVEDVDPVGIVSACNNTHQLAWVKMPQREHRFRIVGSVMKPVSTGRFLIGTAKEHPIALLDELQSPIERGHASTVSEDVDFSSSNASGWCVRTSVTK